MAHNGKTIKNSRTPLYTGAFGQEKSSSRKQHCSGQQDMLRQCRCCGAGARSNVPRCALGSNMPAKRGPKAQAAQDQQPDRHGDQRHDPGIVPGDVAVSPNLPPIEDVQRRAARAAGHVLLQSPDRIEPQPRPECEQRRSRRQAARPPGPRSPCRRGVLPRCLGRAVLFPIGMKRQDAACDSPTARASTERPAAPRAAHAAA